ncbi:MAG: S8/S53 family peptidase, partial [Lachnospiraceae bacterium]|nr:S8/S53 family peptidase [Lachnospiraceae bacterium]
GIKVGILDWGFGFAEHDDLYAGGKDFAAYSNHDDNFNHTSEHGFWMAQTLKEIAPDVSIYALGTYCPGEDAWVDAMIEAIDWAIEQHIDILTLSHEQLSDKNRARFDEAVNRAVANGIVTTFIHYDNPNNILPWGIWSETGEEYYQRAADINVFQYDYNLLLMENYTNGIARADFDETYKSQVFTSVSSMSVVTAGSVALLKEIDNTLTPAQYKEILMNTSRRLEYEGKYAEHVLDMEAAVRYLMDREIDDYKK